jgi:DASS family divalent anion:Na+ symporter
MTSPLAVAKGALPFAIALGVWFAPVPGGLTPQAWHLFALFVGAISSVLVSAFPLLASTMIAVAAVVLTGTITPRRPSAALPIRACCWW